MSAAAAMSSTVVPGNPRCDEEVVGRVADRVAGPPLLPLSQPLEGGVFLQLHPRASALIVAITATLHHMTYDTAPHVAVTARKR